MKASISSEAKRLEDIPNIGKRVAQDLRLLGIQKPHQLKKKNPLTLYRSLSKKTGSYIDPCMLDVFMAAVDFMNGGKALPWWAYTSERKRLYGTGGKI